jgi:CheY-like chemotaxis protein
VVVDLNLPRLDGCGLLRRLRDDVVARESAVLVLSAQQDDVDTLKTARVGARAYLKKSGRTKDLLSAVALLAAPRARAWASLEQRQQTQVELRSVGAVWLLRALAELDCAGRLEAEDTLGRYELTTADGLFLQATAPSPPRAPAKAFRPCAPACASTASTCRSAQRRPPRRTSPARSAPRRKRCCPPRRMASSSH